MKVNLSRAHRATLRKTRTSVADLARMEPAAVSRLLEIPERAAAELVGLATFQGIHTIGPTFAADLVAIGYTSLEQLRGKSGSDLLDEHERLIGYRTDPCVEDQFRRVVHFAETGDNTLGWHDFTAARKAYRTAHGYPADRPVTHWTEVYHH